MENKRNPFPRYSIWIQLTVLTILMLCVSLPAQDEPFSWLGPDGEILPFTSPDEMEAFLETAMVIEIKRIDMGVTHPMKLLLEKDGVRLHAIFRNLSTSCIDENPSIDSSYRAILSWIVVSSCSLASLCSFISV